MTLRKILIIFVGLLLFAACTEFPGKKIYRIARDPSWYPLNLLGKERQLLAFSDELFLAIARDQGINIVLLKTSSVSLFPGLFQHHYDAVISTMPPTSFNRRRFNISNPYYLVGPVLVVHCFQPRKDFVTLG